MDAGSGDDSNTRVAALEQTLRETELRLSDSARLCEELRAELSETRADLEWRVTLMKRAEKLARVGYWYADLRTGNVLWSEGMSNLLGFSASAQSRRLGEIYDYVHPEDRAAVHRAVAEAMNGTRIYMAEFRALGRAGDEHTVRIVGEIEFKGERPVANFGVGQDITPIRQAEAALQASEERCRQQAAELALIYETAPIGLCVLDRELRFTHVNERLAEINGVPVEEHLRRTVREVVPAIAERAEPLLRKVLATGQPVLDFEFSAQTGAQPGVQRTWVSQYWPIADRQGHVTGINAVIEEITTKRLFEEARRSAQEFRNLAENSPDLISRFDRSLRRVYTNPAIERIFGRPRDEVVGKTNEELGMPPELAAKVGHVISEVFETGEPRTTELTVAMAGGERVLDTRYIPEFGAGKATTVLVISRDVTERKRAESELRERESRFRRQAAELETIYKYAPIGLTVLDRDLRYLRVNERLAELNGVSPAEHLGRTVREVVPALAARTEEYVRRVIESGEPVSDSEMRGETRARPGVQRIWNTQWVPLKDADRKVWGVNVVVEEITERKHAEELLSRREQEFEALVERSPDLIARVDREGTLLYVNPVVERITGRERAWFIGKRPSEMELSPREAGLRERVVKEVVSSGRELVAEHEHQGVSGDRHFQTRLVPEFGPDGEVASVLIVDRDITDLKRAQLALEEQTLHDPLTGAANRRYLNRFIDREWRREVRHHHSIAVLMADIDHFKAYNDLYGHQRGDECLREISRVLGDNLRRPTDILVRFGGEEFAMVLLESDLHAAARLAATMQHAVAQRRVLHEGSPVAPVVTISLGVAAAPAQTITFDALLSAADRALYRAKQNGRNRVEVSESPGRQA